MSLALLRLHLRLAGELSADDWALLDHITLERAAQVAADDKTRQCSQFQQLHRAQHPATQADYKKTVINLSSLPQEDAAYLALGLNYAVSPTVLRIEDILTGVEKATVSPPVEAAEEVRQETILILKASGRPRDNLSGAVRRALRSLGINAYLTLPQADKGNATVVLNTKEYNKKVSDLLRALTYWKLPKDPTEAVEWKTTLLLKKSSLPEVVQQLWPQNFRSPRLYGLLKIHKERVPLRPNCLEHTLEVLHIT
jgi:hypothetical protein